MVKVSKTSTPSLIKKLVESSFLFKGLSEKELDEHFGSKELKIEKLFSNRPVYTAFLPNEHLEVLYVIIDEGLVIVRSTPLDRIIAISYPGGCFGMRSLPFSYGLASRAFPCLVESYKTTHVVKIPLDLIESFYANNETFRERYRLVFELREKFEYHLLNCSSYPPQAVAALLRGLLYQERALSNQPDESGIYHLDLPIDVIARACQLNQRTVEQVLKGMQQMGLIRTDSAGDIISILDAEALKEVYSATRDKVNWWPLKS